MNQYKIGKKIGAGSFGIVYKVTHKLLEENRAMKIIYDYDQTEINEAKICLGMNHQNINPLH